MHLCKTCSYRWVQQSVINKLLSRRRAFSNKTTKSKISLLTYYSLEPGLVLEWIRFSWASNILWCDTAISTVCFVVVCLFTMPMSPVKIAQNIANSLFHGFDGSHAAHVQTISVYLWSPNWLVPFSPVCDVPNRLFFKLAVTVHRCLNGRAPPYLSDYCVPAAGADTRRHLHSVIRQLLAVPRYWLNTYGCRAFSITSPTVWNSLPDFIRDLSSVQTVSDVCIRHICLLDTSAFSRFLTITALYKSIYLLLSVPHFYSFFHSKPDIYLIFVIFVCI